jgi:DNA-directed RNA polymerase subunit alpha
MNARLESCGLSGRALYALNGDNIITIGELIRHSEHELLRVPNFGRRSLNEVIEFLANRGLSLRDHDAPIETKPLDIKERLAAIEKRLAAVEEFLGDWAANARAMTARWQKDRQP